MNGEESTCGVTPSQEPSREQRLERALTDMEARKDGAYEERNKVVAALAKLFPSGIARTAIEGWSEDWHGCVYIDLPTGQVSWHFHDSQAHLFAGLPPYTKPWDGHDTPEKYRRLAALPHGVEVHPDCREGCMVANVGGYPQCGDGKKRCRALPASGVPLGQQAADLPPERADVDALIAHVRDIPNFRGEDREKAIQAAARGIETLARAAGVAIPQTPKDNP